MPRGRASQGSLFLEQILELEGAGTSTSTTAASMFSELSGLHRTASAPVEVRVPGEGGCLPQPEPLPMGIRRQPLETAQGSEAIIPWCPQHLRTWRGGSTKGQACSGQSRWAGVPTCLAPHCASQHWCTGEAGFFPPSYWKAEMKAPPQISHSFLSPKSGNDVAPGVETPIRLWHSGVAGPWVPREDPGLGRGLGGKEGPWVSSALSWGLGLLIGGMAGQTRGSMW